MVRQYPCGCDGRVCCPEECRLHAASETAFAHYVANGRRPSDWTAYESACRMYRQHFETQKESRP